MKLLVRLSGILAALVMWQAMLILFKPAVIPSPPAVFFSILANFNELIKGMAFTAWGLLQGLLFAFIFATCLAVLSSRYSIVRLLIEGPMEVIRPIPPIALTPFFIILLGLGSTSQIGLISLGCFMIFYIGWIESFDRTPDALVNSARSFGYTGLRLVIFVRMPFAWPDQKPIWRLAIGTGLSLSVAAEYLGAQGGLGYLIRNARTLLDLGLVGGASVLLGCVAVGIDRIVVLLVDFLTPWSNKGGK